MRLEHGTDPRTVATRRSRPDLSAIRLRKAISQGELRVLYQPQVELSSGRISGAEALVRWDHPDAGLLSPAEFLPQAEASGEIAAVDDQVLRQACTDLASWRDAGHADVRVAVNMSVRSLEDPHLPARIEALQASHTIGPSQLEVEVTESAATSHRETIVRVLRELRERGVLIALDDFGTGYSMLGRLRDLPFDALKIDRSFVAGLSADSGPQLLLAAITLGHALRLRVVAEGVEDSAQLGMLKRYACDEVQGYLLGRPMTTERLLVQLRGRARLPAEAGPSSGSTAARSRALERLVRPLLSELGRLTGLESTYLTLIDEAAGEQVILFARNAGELLVAEGLHVPWEDTVCKRSLERGVRCTSDVARTFPDSPAGRNLGLRTYAGVPVLTRDGSVWGTICGASRSRRTVREPTLTMMEAFARLVSEQLDRSGWQWPQRLGKERAEASTSEPSAGYRRALGRGHIWPHSVNRGPSSYHRYRPGRRSRVRQVLDRRIRQAEAVSGRILAVSGVSRVRPARCSRCGGSGCRGPRSA